MQDSSSARALKLLALALFTVPPVLAVGATPACTSRACNALYVPSRATIQRTVTTHFDPAKPIHVEICKNADCQSADFVADTTARNARLCRTVGDLPFETGCTFVRTSDGAYAFEGRWVGEETPFTNGDRYRATLMSAEGPLLNVEASATYEESEPNGEGCGTVKTAKL